MTNCDLKTLRGNVVLKSFKCMNLHLSFNTHNLTAWGMQPNPMLNTLMCLPKIGAIQLYIMFTPLSKINFYSQFNPNQRLIIVSMLTNSTPYHDNTTPAELSLTQLSPSLFVLNIKFYF